MGKSGGKGISYFGLVAMGIGCMLGTSWLLLTGTWLETCLLYTSPSPRD